MRFCAELTNFLFIFGNKLRIWSTSAVITEDSTFSLIWKIIFFEFVELTQNISLIF
jgi:hypothetical protein